METKKLIELAVSIAKAAGQVCETSRRDIGFGVMGRDILRVESGILGKAPLVQIDIKTFYSVFGDSEYTYCDTPFGKSVEINIEGVVVCAVVM